MANKPKVRMITTNATKSIDVGSMFLMDLSVHESDTNGDSSDVITIDHDHNSMYHINKNMQREKRTHQHHHQSQLLSRNHEHHYQQQSSDYYSKNLLATTSIVNHHQHQHHHHNHNIRDEDMCEFSDQVVGSLDRLACAIHSDYCDHDSTISKLNNNNNDTNNYHPNPITIVEPQPPPEPSQDANSEPSSFSDESFVATSSGSSISNDDESCISNNTSLSASLMASDGDSDDDDNDEEDERENINVGDENDDIDFGDRVSTTTREDSGVLDMKDLDGQFNYSFEDDGNGENVIRLNENHNIDEKEEKPISTIKINNSKLSTNLIKQLAKNSSNNNKKINSNEINFSSNSHRLNNINIDNSEPTNINNNSSNKNSSNYRENVCLLNSNNTNIDCSRSNFATRSISASLPIKVPARQMKKDLNTLKLNIMMINNKDHETRTMKVFKKTDKQTNIRSKEAASIDDVDEFLEQEYNDNHNNHYPIFEHDDGLKADENPMKLFENIQALARSLHEDAELFGSLPPKRMLESPIRSLALV